ncbi:MAG: 2Fe-2S iron-sulfur cluster-binding protein [Deltaproteobacteria bacterium]|nr:2Fe-2S iron-sulfur cluster-binding protein [Deltaproteobacteria bacterium]
MATVTLTIDGQTVTVPAGTTVIEAAKTIGIDIPRYCYHPGLSVAGNCRICLVEVEKMPKLTTSCSTVAAEGMVVHTKNARVKEATRGVLELMLTNHPIDCPVCDQAGECKLQDYYMEVGRHKSHFTYEKTHKPKVVELPPHLMFDGERCILCTRCVRFCDEITKTHDLGLIQRGTHTEIDTFHHRGVDNGYTGNLHEICPVGALLSKDFRFKKRVWWLKPHKSVCPHCSTGCNIFVDESDGEVSDSARGRTRTSTSIGSATKAAINTNSSTPKTAFAAPRTKGSNGTPMAWDAILHGVAERLTKAAQGDGRVVGIASPWLTNEELFLFRRLLTAAGHADVDFRLDDSHTKTTVREDDVLKRADKNPNNSGAALLGLRGTKDARTLLNEVVETGASLLYVLDAHRYETLGLADALRSAAAKAGYVVMHATHDCAVLEAADVVLATPTFAEKDGTLTNYENRVQRLRRAIRPRHDSRTDLEIFVKLLTLAGADVPPIVSASEAFNWMAAQVPALSGLTFGGLPEQGVVVKP